MIEGETIPAPPSSERTGSSHKIPVVSSSDLDPIEGAPGSADADTQPENEAPLPPWHDPHVAANVIANAITEQLRPFLEKQEQRDQRMMSMIETLIDKRSHDSQRLERIESRLEKVEARCVLEHGDIVRLRRDADDTGE